MGRGGAGGRAGLPRSRSRSLRHSRAGGGPRHPPAGARRRAHRARHHRHAARRPRRLLRSRGRRDARARRPRRRGRPLRDRDLPGAAHAALARDAAHRARPAAARRPAQRLLPPAARTWCRWRSTCAASGFATAAFVSAFVLDGRFGLDRGFDHYDDQLGMLSTAERPAACRAARRPDRRRGLAWLDAAPGRFFLWVHLYDPHAPYEPPPPFAARFAGRPYDGEIAFADAQLGAAARGDRGALAAAARSGG